ncbi:MAG: chitinase [Planctomycetota bacterium]
MCIRTSVGKGVRNSNSTDVKTIQYLLNLNLGRIGPLRKLQIDGKAGRNTIRVIEEFQRVVQKTKKPDGRVDPPGPTAKTILALRDGVPKDFSTVILRGIFISASEARVNKFAPHLLRQMNQAKMNTRLRRAHFLAQIGHESGGLRYTEELASGEAYEGRKDLGNTETGDGKKFKGRGLIQLTGRENYKRFSDSRIPQADYVDFTTGSNAKKIASSPLLSVEVSIWFWERHKLSKLADSDDLLAITKKINGGTNGLADRRRRLARAKFFLR